MLDKMEVIMVITVDGPSGIGKSSVSRRLAKKLGFAFLDTGALYRGIALGVYWSDIKKEEEINEVWLVRLKLRISFMRDGNFFILLNGQNIEPFIRNEKVAKLASKLSTFKVVRNFLLNLQRESAININLVAEGRDIGTVVFPAAEIKFFLTACLNERAYRRWFELKFLYPNVTLRMVQMDLDKRDQRDVNRFLAPLKPAVDTLVVNTTFLNEDKVLALMLKKSYQYLFF